MGLGAKCPQAQQIRTKQRFTLLLKPGQRRRPLQNLQKEREFVVDLGASMHMLCKRDSSSDEMDTLRRSRKPTTVTVLTANGEVQTCEEAQVYVHDLDLSMTVPSPDDTPAVLSLGKLCEDHRFCYEWVSGQKPRLTKQGKTIVCKTENFVLMVVPELSSSSSTSFTSQLRSEVTSSHQELFSRNPARDSKDSHDRLRDLPEWLEEFTDNLEDTELPAPAHISQDSDSERPTKVVSQSRKHSVYTHFPKDRNCDVCLRTRITRSPCRRRTGEAVLRAERLGDLMTADHKVPNKEGESRNNHRYAVVVQDLATQWIQSYPCKTKTSQEKSLRKFLEPSEKPKVIDTDNSLEFGKSCEELSWNHRTSAPHRSETKALRKSRTKSERYFSSIAQVRTG